MLFDRVDRGKVHVGVAFLGSFIIFIRCISVPNRVNVVKLIVLVAAAVSLIDKLRPVVASAACVSPRCKRAALSREAASLVLDVIVAGTSRVMPRWNTTWLVQCLQVLLHSKLFIVGHRRPDTLITRLASKRIPHRLADQAPTCYQLALLSIYGRGWTQDGSCTLEHSWYVWLLSHCHRYKNSLSLCWTQHSRISVLTLIYFTRFNHRSISTRVLLNTIRDLLLNG